MSIKIFNATLLFFACVFSASAQEDDSKFNFGLSVTPAVSWFTSNSESTVGDGSKVGFAYGLVCEYSFAHRYAFSSGIDISYRGGKLKTSYGDTVVSGNFQNNYVGVPLTLKMRTKRMKDLAYFGQFGLIPEFNFAAKAEFDYSDGRPSTKPSIKDDVTDFNMSLRVGVGAEFFITDNTRLFGGLTWNQGLIDVFDIDGINSKNNFIALQIGVFF